MLNRRSFFKRSGLAATATLGGWPSITHAAETLNQRAGQKPRQIIHLVADGMSVGTLTCADLYSRIARKRGLAWLSLYERPDSAYGLVNMRSLNSLVTDSSAASSSWGCGSRVLNGAVNALPNGLWLTPLYTLFANAGWARGLVTTTEITHATPAGFAANASSRDSAQLIAAQYLERKVDVLLGGGRQFFDSAKRRDKRDLKAAYKTAGYQVVETREDLYAAPGGPLLGLFAEGHLPYTIDRASQPIATAHVPSLAEMARAALERLAAKGPFILQVEGGRVDHAAHNSDGAAAIHEMIAFDEALETCLEFQKSHADTLIVVTTDHGNSNLGLNGMGGGYGHSSMCLERVARVTASLPEILAKIKSRGEKVRPPKMPAMTEKAAKLPYELPPVTFKYEAEEAELRLKTEEEKKAKEKPAPKTRPFKLYVSAADIREVIGQATQFQVSLHRAALFSQFILGKYVPLNDSLNSETAQLGQLMGNYLGIGWTGTSHTADYTQLAAVGPGAARFSGFIQNTDIFKHYTDLADIAFKNPELPVYAEVGMGDPEVEAVAAYGEPYFDAFA